MSKGALVTGIVIIQCPMPHAQLPIPNAQFPMPIPNLAGINYGTHN